MNGQELRDPAVPVPEVRAVRAPNPGPMTLTGTNTYVVRDGLAAWVVDPGPRESAHLDAVVAACGLEEGVRPLGVLVTHRHADHAEAAGTMRRRLEDRSGTDVRLWAGDVAAVPGARPLPSRLDGPHGCAAHVIHLPGHTADSVGVLVEGGRMLTGDTLLGGSSTVIAPPDGDVATYLQSLRILRALCIDGRISSLLPGHGDEIPSPNEARARIEEQIEHRLQRVEQVREARAAGALTMQRLIRAVYGAELDPGLREAAEQNLRATIEYIRQGG